MTSFSMLPREYDALGRFCPRCRALVFCHDGGDGTHKKFLHDETTAVVKHVFRKNIAKGKTRTRQTTDNSPAAFVAKKSRSMRDYADAIFCHLRANYEISKCSYNWLNLVMAFALISSATSIYGFMAL